jgi:hypothetical protein
MAKMSPSQLSLMLAQLGGLTAQTREQQAAAIGAQQAAQGMIAEEHRKKREKAEEKAKKAGIAGKIGNVIGSVVGGPVGGVIGGTIGRQVGGAEESWGDSLKDEALSAAPGFVMNLAADKVAGAIRGTNPKLQENLPGTFGDEANQAAAADAMKPGWRDKIADSILKAKDDPKLASLVSSTVGGLGPQPKYPAPPYGLTPEASSQIRADERAGQQMAMQQKVADSNMAIAKAVEGRAAAMHPQQLQNAILQNKQLEAQPTGRELMTNQNEQAGLDRAARKDAQTSGQSHDVNMANIRKNAELELMEKQNGFQVSMAGIQQQYAKELNTLRTESEKDLMQARASLQADIELPQAMYNAAIKMATRADGSINFDALSAAMDTISNSKSLEGLLPAQKASYLGNILSEAINGMTDAQGGKSWSLTDEQIINNATVIAKVYATIPSTMPGIPDGFDKDAFRQQFNSIVQQLSGDPSRAIELMKSIEVQSNTMAPGTAPVPREIKIIYDPATNSYTSTE